MEADVAAEVYTVNGAAGVFDEARDGLAHDRGVEMANVEDFEGVGVGEFGDDIFIFICVT